MAQESDNGGWLDTFQDFISGAADSVLEYGLPDWLDYDTPATNKSAGGVGQGGNGVGGWNNPGPVDAAGWAPWILAGYNPSGAAGNPGNGINMQTILLIGAGAALVAGVIVLVTD